MHFNILTIFPEFFESPMSCGLMGKAQADRIFDYSLINPRDFAQDRRSVDDRPYGGGPGMVMSLEPLINALRSLSSLGRILLLSPKGRPLEQHLASELAQEEQLTLICGRYEGIDSRLENLFPIEQVSVGDFVLNGGEAAGLCLMESVARLLPDFMGRYQSVEEESFSQGLLEYPHYTRPEVFEGQTVPKVLLSGNHGVVAKWRREQALISTLQHRPEILKKNRFLTKDIDVLRKQQRRKLGRFLFVILVHYPVLNSQGKITAVSLTNLDIHDIARVSCSYALGGYYISTPLKDQQVLAQRLLDHWRKGPGREANPDRAQAVDRVHLVADIEQALDDIGSKCGQEPYLVATSAREAGGMPPATVRNWLEERPVVLLLGTGHGLAPELLQKSDDVLRSIRFLDAYNHLSVRTAAAVTIDRILGDIY